jgi:hypothetical protein
MNLKDKARLWLLSHLKHPENLTQADQMAITFLVETLPELIGIIIGFSIMTWIYMFLLKKYGFEKTAIIMLINLVFAIGQVRKAVSKLSERKI